MQAVILVGGEGTRLRPLTSGMPKPIVTLVDRPFMAYMLQWLAAHGVDDVIMCCGFLATKVVERLGDGSRYGLRLRFVEEPEPRGTAGALRFAEPLLAERFMMLNGDVLTDIDISAQLEQHQRTRATGTLALVSVTDPSAYGLVLQNADESVRGFLEKPRAEQLAGLSQHRVSAGIYALERSVLDLIPTGRAVSIEREVWPVLVGQGLYGYHAQDAYWLDIGTPERYLQATGDILEGRVRTAVATRLDAERRAIAGHVHPRAKLSGAVIVEAGARVGDGASVVGPAVIGAGASVGEDAHVCRSVILAGAEVGPRARLSEAILAPRARVGAGSEIKALAMLGEGADAGADNTLAGGMKLAPGMTLADASVSF